MSGPIFKPNNIEIAPLSNTFEGGAVFKGAGNSHFTFAQGSFHETTSIPGIGKAEGMDGGYSKRFDIDDIKW
ncbi:hypothetical protein C0583_01255 [Candidatus Parcubacteria bacterium]|nr:MAG: hypothetical protein C0583_01255 [Candidatus Parcubacteria bacterium]